MSNLQKVQNSIKVITIIFMSVYLISCNSANRGAVNSSTENPRERYCKAQMAAVLLAPTQTGAFGESAAAASSAYQACMAGESRPIQPTVASPASNNCECQCVNGKVVPLCSSATMVAPICAPRICPIVTPSITPIQAPSVPPIGTTTCSPKQVLNEQTHQYEWRKVCY